MRWWSWALIGVLLAGAVAYGGHSFVQWRIDQGISVRRAELDALVARQDKEIAESQARLTAATAASAKLRAELKAVQESAARASRDRDEALRSAAAAAAAREGVHADVAKVPQSEVRGRVRRGLSRLGLLPAVGSGG